MNEQEKNEPDLSLNFTQLLDDIRKMINDIQSIIAITANAGLTMLYWKIGTRINKEILKGKRAEYGMKIVSTVSRQLETEYGNGYSIILRIFAI